MYKFYNTNQALFFDNQAQQKIKLTKGKSTELFWKHEYFVKQRTSLKTVATSFIEVMETLSRKQVSFYSNVIMFFFQSSVFVGNAML